MIKNCRDKGLIKGLGCQDDSNTFINLHFIDDSNTFINLHFIDDTLIFGRGYLVQVTTLKWILCYERWSGLSINYHKSALIFLGDIMGYNELISLIFNCPYEDLTDYLFGTVPGFGENHEASVVS